uniref:UmuC domain-containing protein n=1 Tax=Ascaris lumbricoides TaxID=6252 RepID=A0A0M3IXK8_ASCLU
MFPTTHLANGNDIKASNETIWKYDREANLREWIIEACVQQRQALRLAVAAEIVERIRAEIKEKTQFSCSAGIGSNKVYYYLIFIFFLLCFHMLLILSFKSFRVGKFVMFLS